MNSAAAASSAARSISASVASGPAEADVVAHAHAEDRGVLRHQRDVAAQLRRIGVGQPHAVERHRAGLRIVEAQDQVEDRALAGAGGADDGDLLAGLDAKRHAVEHVGLRPRRIGEAHRVERDLGARPLRQRHADARARWISGSTASSSISRSAAPAACDSSPQTSLNCAEPACGKHREQHELAEPCPASSRRRSRPARRPRARRRRSRRRGR